ncbi:hypothetical protein [Neolewinella xylanilytica]|uniref:hypothetical protein n=1 Tax=Neolewinella xylanilytica TaxID=1514080 RepID=UPI0011B0055A|nr:hypothetical protein [Neolewinella xylanilytica]
MFTTKYVTCPSCHENSSVPTDAVDRVDLERAVGERFTASCKHCHKPRSIHVNEVHATPNRAITVVAGGIGLVAIGALWHIGFIAYAAGAFPVLVYQAQVKSAATFNGYQLPLSRP